MRARAMLTSGDLHATAALAALLLLPGLLVVRAPWTHVPLLSAGFWIVSWWWLPEAASRRHFVLVVLGGSALFAGLRLLKPLVAAKPSWPAALVALVAVSRLAPFASWLVGPDDHAALQALAALLMVWRDGVPATYLPLLPLHHFGADGTGVPGLAADVVLASGAPAARAALLVALAAGGLVVIAAYALGHAFRGRPRAAVGAVIGLGVLGVPRPTVASIGGDVSLAAALACAAAALLVRGSGRAPAFAAGMLLAAACETEPSTTLALLLLAPLAAWPALRRTPRERRAAGARWGIALAFGVLLCAPFLCRAGLALEARHVAGAGCAGAAIAAAPLVVAGLAGRRRGWSAAVLAVVAAAGLVGLWHEVSGAGVDPPLDAAQAEAIASIADRTNPLDVVCAGASRTRAWIPVLAQRRVHPAPAPRAYADEFGRADAPERCALNVP